MAIWMDGRIGLESAWIERRVWGLIIIIQSEPPTPPPTHRNGNRKIIIITRTTNRDRGKTKQNQTEQNEFLEFLKSHKTTTSFDLIFEIQSTGIEHMYGYVKNTFQFTLSPADRVPLKKTPQTNHPKMRGCCGRELGHMYILDTELDRGSNSSSVISVPEEKALRQCPVAAHARVMILWPFYN
ncbi:LOW QUALITY PROTEIN: uncharacterized protein [Drosophila suzukii]|uniref:LOW QUALITY PROTEIN: uncharacterized protein n=1 Tax=Drosophila suzukii TaxID=28584 RepID=A0ABM4TR80_DROSZ